MGASAEGRQVLRATPNWRPFADCGRLVRAAIARAKLVQPIRGGYGDDEPTDTASRHWPGGFEKFFDALGRIPEEKVNDAAIRQVMAKYGMDVVGPPLFGLWRQQRR